MANQRVLVGSGLTPERFSPRASPVDTSVTPKKSKLGALAQGLTEFNPALARFSEQTLERKAKGEQMEGSSEAQRLIEGRKTYKQAVDEGLIRQDQNPWFRLGMKRQFALASADQYGHELQAEASQMIALGADDPSQFAEVEARVRREFMEKTVGSSRDAGFDAFFADAANGKAAGIGQAFAQAAGANAVQGFLKDTGARATGILSNTDGRTAAEVGQALDDLAKEAIKEFGLSGTRVNDVVGEAIIEYAISHKDPDALQYAKFVKTGGGSSLWDIPSFKGLVRGALEEIDDAEIRQFRRDKARRDNQAQEIFAEFAREVEEHRKNGGSIHDMDYRAIADRVRQYSPELADAILSTPGTLDRGDMVEDSVALTGLSAQVVAGDLQMPAIVSRWRGGSLSDNGYMHLMALAYQRIQQQQSIAKGEEDPFQDNFWKDKKSFLRHLAGSQSMFESFQLEAGRAAEHKAELAQTWAMRRWNQYWYQGGGREATGMERREELDKIFAAAAREFFPLSADTMGQAGNASLVKYEPLAWDRPILTPQTVFEVRGAVSRDGNLSNGTVAQLWRYGVPDHVLNASSPEALTVLDGIARRQERAHNMPWSPWSTGDQAAPAVEPAAEPAAAPVAPTPEASAPTQQGDREISRAGSGSNPNAPTQRPARPTRPTRPTRPDTAERLREGRRIQDISSVEGDIQAANQRLEDLKDQTGPVAAQNRRVWERRVRTLQDRLDRLNQ
jgi:hypothetical protein